MNLIEVIHGLVGDENKKQTLKDLGVAKSLHWHILACFNNEGKLICSDGHGFKIERQF